MFNDTTSTFQYPLKESKDLKKYYNDYILKFSQMVFFYFPLLYLIIKYNIPFSPFKNFWITEKEGKKEIVEKFQMNFEEE